MVNCNEKNCIQTMQNNLLIDGVIYGINDKGKKTSLMESNAQTGKTFGNEKSFKWLQRNRLMSHSKYLEEILNRITDD